jgi:hypothetical protein
MSETKTVRAKFKCERADKYPMGEDHQVEVNFHAVYGEDGSANASWSKWTPSGQLSMTISNPNLVDHFEVGKEYYLDIKEAE